MPPQRHTTVDVDGWAGSGKIEPSDVPEIEGLIVTSGLHDGGMLPLVQ